MAWLPAPPTRWQNSWLIVTFFFFVFTTKLDLDLCRRHSMGALTHLIVTVELITSPSQWNKWPELMNWPGCGGRNRLYSKGGEDRFSCKDVQVCGHFSFTLHTYHVSLHHIISEFAINVMSMPSLGNYDAALLLLLFCLYMSLFMFRSNLTGQTKGLQAVL